MNKKEIVASSISRVGCIKAYPVALGNVIVEIRKSKKMKQKDLAELANIPVTVLSMIENNKREAGMRHLKEISKALEIPYQILMLKSLDEDEISTEHLKSFRKLIKIVNKEFA